MSPSALDLFSPPARAWFTGTFAAPTEVQDQGWRAVASGAHTLMCAPTGSGKTLAAFLWSIDRLMQEPEPVAAERCRVLYVSPLKALTTDIERNLRSPLRGIALAAEHGGGGIFEPVVAVRTGDTPARERRGIERHPPDILITTPESLFLMLTSAVRAVLRSVRWVIVDEIHSIAPTKRGAHFALSMERLCAITRAEPQRIGLSATQRPLDEVARFLTGGGRDAIVVDAGAAGDSARVVAVAGPGREAGAGAGGSDAPRPLGKVLELSVEVPVEDMSDLDRGAHDDADAGGDGSPRRSIWPAMHPRILELIRAHRSTIVFVNSRRLAERLAARLNELAGEELVRAHHGSIARDQRVAVEEMLKTGRLPALVATSSLELGIDMGAVDLVIQIEAPTSVAAGVQRVGRAGHHVGEPSRGVIFPKFRGDLLECAAVVERMLAGEIETTRVQRNPLDVLAQQIVAMTALDEWRVEDLGALVRRAYPFAQLGDRGLTSTLEMLAGAYPGDEFAELRPRIVWDRVDGTVRGRAGAQRLAVVSGGTIPDRGLYPVNLLDDGRRVGELDEEMVYEMRPGETFILGATTWRAADITPSQVLVTPAPGEPGRPAFWHGDALGRPVELGRAIGVLLRELSAVDDHVAIARLRSSARFDDRAARNLVAYVREQQQATGAVPDDRTIVVERFRDQLGDWRLCVLTPLGARVHAPWALAAAARLRDLLDAEIHAIHTDDGFALRLPDIDSPPDVEAVLLDPEEIDALVTDELAGSPLFAARFRENAARALLLPRRRPGERTPLWKQRQRGHDLLQVAARHPTFPILVETYRECLSDVFDMPALRDVLTDLRSRRMRVVVADTERASPFAGSLLFDFIAEYMYEGDAPLAERRAQALALDRELLSELLGSEELRELLDPQAVAHLELELQGLLGDRHPRDPDEAADLLRRLGDLSNDEAAARGVLDDWRRRLVAERRIVELRIAGEPRWVAVEDAALYRDALGSGLPPGLPEAFAPPVADPLLVLLRRYGRTHVPFTTRDAALRLGLTDAIVERTLLRLSDRGEVLAGEFLPGRSGREWCHAEVLRMLRRRSLAALRREVEPVALTTLARFVPEWHGVGSRAHGIERLAEVVAQLQGAPIPASCLERDVLSARVAGYQPRLLDELISMGEVVWAGRGPLGSGDGRVALHRRGDALRLMAPPLDPPSGAVHQSLRAALGAGGAAFFGDLLAATGVTDVDALADALWDLVWAGEVTNDTLAPLRAGGSRRAASRPSRRPLMRLVPPRVQGRWSLLAGLREPAASPTERLHAQATVLLQRHGVLTREAVRAEGVAGGFAALYPVLRAMEEAGRIRRGYFVDSLGASQFALPGAVDRLRGLREGAGAPVALSAVDPANPYGVTVPWPQPEAGAGRLARIAGAYVVLVDGELRLFLERGGRSLITNGAVATADVEALVRVAAYGARVEVLTVDGVAVGRSPLRDTLKAAGFGASHRGVVVYPEREVALARG